MSSAALASSAMSTSSRSSKKKDVVPVTTYYYSSEDDEKWGVEELPMINAFSCGWAEGKHLTTITETKPHHVYSRSTSIQQQMEDWDMSILMV